MGLPLESCKWADEMALIYQLKEMGNCMAIRNICSYGCRENCKHEHIQLFKRKTGHIDIKDAIFLCCVLVSSSISSWWGFLQFGTWVTVS